MPGGIQACTQHSGSGSACAEAFGHLAPETSPWLSLLGSSLERRGEQLEGRELFWHLGRLTALTYLTGFQRKIRAQMRHQNGQAYASWRFPAARPSGAAAWQLGCTAKRRVQLLLIAADPTSTPQMWEVTFTRDTWRISGGAHG
jgi:hypothetical protein